MVCGRQEKLSCGGPTTSFRGGGGTWGTPHEALPGPEATLSGLNARNGVHEGLLEIANTTGRNPTDRMARYPDSPDSVPDGAALPHWSWEGHALGKEK